MTSRVAGMLDPAVLAVRPAPMPAGGACAPTAVIRGAGTRGVAAVVVFGIARRRAL